MKKSIIILSLLLVALTGYPQELKNYDGWEFLDWKTKKEKVEKILAQHKDELSGATALDAGFMYNKMNTWLYYNKQDELVKVHQRKTFSVIQAKEATAFYDSSRAELIKKYGKPESCQSNKNDSVITMIWNLQYTKITLEYDYKYKIIDEFGADSYWIDILFEPGKREW